jgi:membrane associated rhomboid family serine protease
MIPSQLHASTLVTSMFLHGGWLHASSLVTSMFLHGGWLHLIGNMWFLWIFGDNVEDILGHAKYLLFYLLCGVAAALFQVALNMDSPVPTIGASGAIAGVMGAYLVKFPRSRIVTLVFVLFFLTTIEIPASLMLIYWFVLQFFSGVGSIASSHLSQGGVAWFAHVGGFLAGILLIFALRPRERFRRREELHW